MLLVKYSENKQKKLWKVKTTFRPQLWNSPINKKNKKKFNQANFTL